MAPPPWSVLPISSYERTTQIIGKNAKYLTLSKIRDRKAQLSFRPDPAWFQIVTDRYPVFHQIVTSTNPRGQNIKRVFDYGTFPISMVIFLLFYSNWRRTQNGLHRPARSKAHRSEDIANIFRIRSIYLISSVLIGTRLLVFFIGRTIRLWRRTVVDPSSAQRFQNYMQHSSDHRQDHKDHYHDGPEWMLAEESL